MAPRALGALLAILAAIAFVASIASSAWWAGHPTVEGHPITAKHVSVGLFDATGCNTGGDGSCESVTTSSTVQLIGTIELAAIGLTALLSLALAISAWTIGDRRKGLGTATIVVTLGIAATGGVLLAIGPGIEATQHVSVPIGWGTYVFGGGVAASLLASIIARKLEPEPLRLKSGAPLQPPPPDVRDMIREHGTALAPSGPPASRESVPLIGGAPQLRPLYDPNNAGYVPAPQSPSLPFTPPTPYPREQVKALTGSVTPTPERVNPLGASNPGIPSALPGMGDPLAPVDPFARTAHQPDGKAPPASRPKPPSVAPASRPHAPSAPPPVRSRAPSAAPLPNRGKAPSAAPPLPRAKAPSAAPPSVRGVASPGASEYSSTGQMPAPQLRARTTPGPGTDAEAQPLPSRASAPALPDVRPSQPTISHPVPPMPSPENQAPPSVLPARDGKTTVEIDAAAKARARAQADAQARADAKAAGVEATARGTLDPRLAARGHVDPEDDAHTGTHEATVGDITSTGVDVEVAPRAQAETPTGVKIITGAERALSTRERQVARAATADLFDGDRAALVPEDGPLSDELEVVRPTSEMNAEEVPVTDVHPAQSPADLLADELAGQSTSGMIGDVTDQTRSADLLPARATEQTPIPTLHGRAPAQPNVSTASNLPPPKVTVETVPSGPTPACPQCESPMAWVEEHLRFYCKRCRMYF